MVLIMSEADDGQPHGRTCDAGEVDGINVTLGRKRAIASEYRNNLSVFIHRKCREITTPCRGYCGTMSSLPSSTPCYRKMRERYRGK